MANWRSFAHVPTPVIAGGRSRNQNGARTFLSAATSECLAVFESSNARFSFPVAADKNVRAPENHRGLQ